MAVVRDERRIVLVTGGSTQPVVKVFTAAGSVLGAFVWDKGRIAGFAWTSQQELVIIDIKGEVCSLSRVMVFASSSGLLIYAGCTHEHSKAMPEQSFLTVCP